LPDGRVKTGQAQDVADEKGDPLSERLRSDCAVFTGISASARSAKFNSMSGSIWQLFLEGSLGPMRSIANNTNFSVLDETEDYIVVDKPAPLLVHPSVPGNPPTLLDGLEGLLAFDLANGARLSIINRLDRESSGLVLVAKNPAWAARFSGAMARRQVKKEYLAIVWGWPEEDAFTVDAPIRRKGEIEESPVWVRQCIDAGGQASETGLTVERRFERETPNGTRFSLVRAKPVTGRMHQIRVHLAHAGFPIVGDKIYGLDERCYLDFIETGWTTDLEKRLLLPRHALHSARMEMEVEGRSFAWECGLPGEMVEFAG
jgi:23S rRNA pseudouridine1911/1915/1917 synthase